MLPDEPNIKVIANDNYFPKRLGLTPSYIIIHGTAGGTSAEAIANYFASTEGTNNPASAHYIIGVDGEIVQTVSEDDGAYGNGYLSAGHDVWWNPNINPNNITISIEHCKPSPDNSDDLTPAQVQSSFRLIKHICQRRHIPMRLADSTGGITSHASIDPVNRSRCPGSYPWERLWAYLGGQVEEENIMIELNNPIVQKYFVDDGNGNWKCSATNVVLLGAILTFYRTYGGPAMFGLPLTPERRDIPGIVYVICERAIIVYDPARKFDNPPISGPCYLMHIDKGSGQQLLASPVVAPLKKQIEDLQTKLTAAQQAPSPSTTLADPVEHQLITDLRALKTPLASIIGRL